MTQILISLKKDKSKMRTLLLIKILLVISIQAIGQNDYSIFKFYETFRPDSTGDFYLAIENVNFFKNNEYKGDIATGYTLTGTWLRPKIVFYPDKKLRMEFGGYVLKYNGRDEYFNLSPWFNVHYQPTEKISVILGNLNSDFNHNLPEPIADPEMFLTSKPEAGIQAKYKSGKFTADFWIDWQQFILKGDPFKERFAFGTLTNLKIAENKNSVFSIPFIFYGVHLGGEIDIAPGPATSYISITPGLSYTRKISDNIIRELGLNTSFTICTYPKDNLIFNESKGWGYYANGTINTCLGALVAAYWHGHQFYSPQGGIIYQNLSRAGSEMIPENKLVNLKYHYYYQIFRDTFFGFVFDYYYDAVNRQAMNSAGLYLIVNFGVATKRLR
jgi:hypothetical protein